VLLLADGTQFIGKSIGIQGVSSGEVVFNTSMTGYQEIFTDPSYTQQMITLTYPHIGNVGINDQDSESNKIYASGVIIRNLSLIPSSFRSQKSLQDFLREQKIVGISDIDTRHLTTHLRETSRTCDA
jgi:carbamoyl-phosphate synthase small subunit